MTIACNISCSPNFCYGFYCFCQQGHHGFWDVICHKCDRLAAILGDIATVYTVVVVGIFGRKSRAVLFTPSLSLYMLHLLSSHWTKILNAG